MSGQAWVRGGTHGSKAIRPGVGLCALLISAALAGCATAPPPAGNSATGNASVGQNSATESSASTPEALDYPMADLDSSTLYQLLASEMALQRGQPKAAYATYFSLARRIKDPRLAKRSLEIALAENQLDRAYESVQLWSELAPHDPQAQQSLTVLMVAAGRLQEAEPKLKERLALEKKRRDNKEEGAEDDPYNLIARLLGRAPDAKAAYELAQKVFATDLKEVNAQVALSNLAQAAGLQEAAVQHIKLAQKQSDNPDLALLLAQVLQGQSGSNDAAIAELNAYMQRQKPTLELRIAVGRLYASDKKWNEARGVFSDILREFPGNPELYNTLGLIAVQQNDRNAAREYFEGYLAHRRADDPRDPKAVFFSLSQMAEDAKDYPDALKWLDRVADNQSIEVITRRVGILSKQKAYAKAAALLASVKPKTDADKVQLALSETTLLREQDKMPSALMRLNKALDQVPDNPDLLYEKAMVAEKLNHLDVLETSLRRVIALKPDNAHAYNALGYTFADRNIRLEEAATLIEKAVNLAPDNPFILDSLGWIRFRQGKLQEAERILRSAYDNKGDAEIALHLGEVLWALGKKDEANQLLQTVRSREPNNAQLKELGRRLNLPL